MKILQKRKRCFVMLGIGFSLKCKMNQKILSSGRKCPNLVKFVESVSLHRSHPPNLRDMKSPKLKSPELSSKKNQNPEKVSATVQRTKIGFHDIYLVVHILVLVVIHRRSSPCICPCCCHWCGPCCCPSLLLKSLVSSPRICSNEAFNRTNILENIARGTTDPGY